jgi:hypothetical protein
VWGKVVEFPRYQISRKPLISYTWTIGGSMRGYLIESSPHAKTPNSVFAS